MVTIRKVITRGERDLSALNVSRDILSGTISALVTVAYCISFSALIFQGSLSSGLGLGLAALLTGSAVTGLVVALTTTLVPADAGPDTPAVAVMSVLAASIAASFAAAGLSGELAAMHVLMAITVSTFLTGLLLFGLGAFRLGEWLRFVPYPVIGGFLAASGWLLITGGIEVTTGVDPKLSLASFRDLLAPAQLPQLLVGLLFAVFVFVFRQRVRSFLILPITFFVALIILNLMLYSFAPVTSSEWFLEGIGDISLWVPVAVVISQDVNWAVIAANAAEIGAVCGVTAISMLLDVSSLEVARSKTADLDYEFRTNGVANVVAAGLGGVAGNLSLNGSILINEAGAVSRMSGVVAAAVCGLMLLVGGDVALIVPTALLGGLLVYLGLVILTQALIRTPALKSRTDLLFATAIMLAIVNWGYLLGVVLGIIGACLVFVFSYSRIGVVRRHLTRQEFSSNVERSAEQTRFLRECGQKIHVIWLSGFIFFGSSNGLFEYIRRQIDEQDNPPVRFIILDFSAVPGFDSSAMLSLVKLRNYCDAQNVVILISGITEKMLKAFKGTGFFSLSSPHKLFGTRNEAIEWCENSILEEHSLGAVTGDDFVDWLTRELGESVDVKQITTYFERSEIDPGDVLYHQGDPSDSVDLVASGCVAITIKDEKGRPVQLRRMAGQTVVGEMGFFRNVERTASIIADQPTVIYSLSRESFERMQKEHPEAAQKFHKFIIRVLSDRLDFANREISALI